MHWVILIRCDDNNVAVNNRAFHSFLCLCCVHTYSSTMYSERVGSSIIKVSELKACARNNADSFGTCCASSPHVPSAFTLIFPDLLRPRVEDCAQLNEVVIRSEHLADWGKRIFFKANFRPASIDRSGIGEKRRIYASDEFRNEL